MQNWKFYTAVGIVGAIADLGTNMYVSNVNVKSKGALGLRDFYKTINPMQAMIYASVTFVAVVAIADLVYTGISNDK